MPQRQWCLHYIPTMKASSPRSWQAAKACSLKCHWQWLMSTTSALLLTATATEGTHSHLRVTALYMLSSVQHHHAADRQLLLPHTDNYSKDTQHKNWLRAHVQQAVAPLRQVPGWPAHEGAACREKTTADDHFRAPFVKQPVPRLAERPPSDGHYQQTMPSCKAVISKSMKV